MKNAIRNVTIEAKVATPIAIPATVPLGRLPLDLELEGRAAVGEAPLLRDEPFLDVGKVLLNWLAPGCELFCEDEDEGEELVVVWPGELESPT